MELNTGEKTRDWDKGFTLREHNVPKHTVRATIDWFTAVGAYSSPQEAHYQVVAQIEGIII